MKSIDFPKNLYGFYWLCIKKFPWYFWAVFVCGLLGNVINMMFDPWVSKWMIQIFENAISTDWHIVFRLFILIVCLYSFTTFLNFFISVIKGKYQQIFNRYKLYILYKRVYENDSHFFINNPSGQVMSMCIEVSGKLDFLMRDFWSEFIGTVLGFLIIVASMAVMNIWLVVVLLTYGVLKLVWEWLLQKKIKKNNQEEMEESSKYSGLRSDSLNNALTVKLFAADEYENMYIYKGRDRLIELIRQRFFLERLQGIPVRILWVCTRLIGLALCFIFIRNGSMTLSDAAFVMSASYSINNSFDKINKGLQRYSIFRARATKAYSVVIADKLINDKENAKRLSIDKAVISFKSVDFAYGNNKVFKDFNLKINNSEKVGIVGLSGAGKTTLCNLLLRMYDVDKGAVEINDIDIRDVTQDSLRKSISFVPQEATLFNRTILENIRYAKPNATKSQVIDVAKKAHIHDFISKLPKGYNTIIGNNGIKLSGGQRQRISIARALLKDAPILVMDEATSALDSENEMLIQKSLKIAMRGKTTLVIAHRLSTLANMDRIVVIKNGKIVETGTHKQLLRKGGAYSKLWQMQTRKK